MPPRICKNDFHDIKGYITHGNHAPRHINTEPIELELCNRRRKKATWKRNKMPDYKQPETTSIASHTVNWNFTKKNSKHIQNVTLHKAKPVQRTQCQFQFVDLYSASSVDLPNALGPQVPCEQNVFSRRLKAVLLEFGLRTGSGRLFQADGPSNGKSPGRPYVLSRWRGTCSRLRSAERKCLWLDSGMQWTARYWGARPFMRRWNRTTSLNVARSRTSRQWSFSWSSWLSPWSYLPVSLVTGARQHWALVRACQSQPSEHWREYFARIIIINLQKKIRRT